MKKYSKPGLFVLAVTVVVFIVVALGNFNKRETDSNSNQTQNTNVPQGVWLTDVKYSDSDFRVYINKTYSDSGGIGYKHYLTGSGSITYPLHKMYSSLSGRWEVNYNENNSMAKSGALRIYIDDSIVYNSSEVSIANKLYEDVFIDLSNCDTLRIELTPNDGHWCMFHNVWLEPYTNTPGSNQSKPQMESAYSNMNQPMSLTIRKVPAYIDCMDREGYKTTDQYGVEYTDYFDLMAYNDKSYNRLCEGLIILRPLGNWHYLRGRYFPDPYQNDGFLIRFQIFADNDLIYDSGMIDRNAGPVDFDLDIGYASAVKILSHSDDYTFMGRNASIILVNAEVYN